MAKMISILGGVGLFLLGMAVMADGLKALAGSGLTPSTDESGGDVASGALTAKRCNRQCRRARLLVQLAHHAWRAAAHLVAAIA